MRSVAQAGGNGVDYYIITVNFGFVGAYGSMTVNVNAHGSCGAWDQHGNTLNCNG